MAILFTIEIDNVAFRILIPERERTRVEEARHVQLTEAEARMLTRTKVAINSHPPTTNPHSI